MFASEFFPRHPAVVPGTRVEVGAEQAPPRLESTRVQTLYREKDNSAFNLNLCFVSLRHYMEMGAAPLRLGPWEVSAREVAAEDGEGNAR